MTPLKCKLEQIRWIDRGRQMDKQIGIGKIELLRDRQTDRQIDRPNLSRLAPVICKL